MTHWYNKIKVFYDGTNIDKYNHLDYIKGFTTNPSLMNNSNLIEKKYKNFALNMLNKSNNLPVSFEVFADEPEEMIKEAREISSWHNSIYVKIPIVNSKGISSRYVIEQLNSENIKLNITAIFSIEQIKTAFDSLKNKDIPNIISVFAGRIADTGVNATFYIKYAHELSKNNQNIEILWASVREVHNIFEAIESKCDIITIPDSILKKTSNIGKNLEHFSLETVNMFLNDSKKSGVTF